MSANQMLLFLPAENVVLALWLGVDPVEPVDDRLTVRAALQDLGFDHEVYEYDQSDAAVAAILLRNVQRRLPNFRAVDAEGAEIRGRVAGIGSDQRDMLLVPQHLLSINWASSGPGFDWPAAYHATFVPPYDVYVVTLSVDSTDLYGVTDVAIGKVSRDEDLTKRSAEIVEEEWCRLRDRNEQERWEMVTAPGLISESDADHIAERVWSEDEE